jgi:4-amino-4-deoxy-L-arabinose transferase-like glycosyltransferase
MTIKHRRILLAVLAVFFVLHLYNITAPPNGYHQWRESDTAAVMLNYYQEDANFLYPRCNQRGATSGITGMEFPLYNYLGATAYFVFGPHHILPRLLTAAGGIVALLFLFGAVRRLIGEGEAVGATAAMALSPLFFFYSSKIMPDVWMLMFLLGAVFWFVRFTEENSPKWFFFSALSLVLSATIKPLGLCVYLPMLILLLSRRISKLVSFGMMAGYVALTLGLTLGWFLYARHVTEVYGTQAFYMGEFLGRFYEPLAKGEFYKKLLLQWPFELWIGWLLVPATICGAVRAVKDRIGLFFLLWIAGAYVVFALNSFHSQSHDYYSIVIVPPLAVFSGVGLYRFAQGKRWRQWIVVGFCLAAMIALYPRLAHRFDPMEKFDAIREAVEANIPCNALVMVQEETTAIRLYQLNRRGWPLRPVKGGDVISLPEVRAAISEGAGYLVLLEPIEQYRDSLQLLFQDSVISLGAYYAYHVR